MRAIYSCPYCGEDNMVPDDTVGHQYTCYNCNNQFQINLTARCPNCGKVNTFDEECEIGICGVCGHEFPFVTNHQGENPKKNKTPKRRQVSYIKPHSRSRVQFVPYSPRSDIEEILSPLIAICRPFSFAGRASRWEFVGTLLIFLACGIFSAVLEKKLDSESHVDTLVALLTILYLGPCLVSCGTRRARDCDKIKFAFEYFTCAVGFIGLIIFGVGILTVPIGIGCLLLVAAVLSVAPSKY